MPLHPVLSLLAYCLKAPAVPPGAPVVNALAAQRQVLIYMYIYIYICVCVCTRARVPQFLLPDG